MTKEKNIKKANSKGITLVALVVTIVVLLILAGITISTLFGENGIIKKAQDATDATKNAQDDTANGLANLQNVMNEALGENGGGEAPTTTQGVMVDSNTKYAKYTDSSSEGFVPIPGGFGVVTGENNTIAKGLVISDLEGDTLDNNEINGKRGNQFVWVPVSDPTAMYGVSSKDPATAKKYGKLYNFSATEITKNNWTETDGVMTITSSISYREPDILIDKTYGDAVTGNSIKGIGQLKSVIGITADEGVADANQNILDKWKAQLQKDFDDMIASVERYGGFYIGRYETGDLNQTKAVVQKNNSNIASINWYTMYQKSKGILSEENQKNATTSMIWGCQWDRTLQWLVESGDKTYAQLVDSSSWGNYSNYKSTTGDTSTASGGSNPQPTGTNKSWQANHIYDLAGNVWDWTIEANYAKYRILRRRSLQRFRL